MNEVNTMGLTWRVFLLNGWLFLVEFLVHVVAQYDHRGGCTIHHVVWHTYTRNWRMSEVRLYLIPCSLYFGAFT